MHVNVWRPQIVLAADIVETLQNVVFEIENMVIDGYLYMKNYMASMEYEQVMVKQMVNTMMVDLILTSVKNISKNVK